MIGTWYKAGLFGLAGILIALFAVFRAGLFALVGSRSAAERREAAALTSAVVAFVAFSMSEPILYSRFGWIAPALLLALRAVQEREGQQVALRALENRGRRRSRCEPVLGHSTTMNSGSLRTHPFPFGKARVLFAHGAAVSLGTITSEMSDDN